MSKHVRIVPGVFLHYHGLTLPRRAVDRKQHVDCGRQESSVRLRDDHIVLLTIDALLALHGAFKKWRNRRRTLRALADLDERQLRDIGLVRDENDYRAIEDLDAERKDDIGA